MSHAQQRHAHDYHHPGHHHAGRRTWWGHSHDVAEQVDSVLDSDPSGQQALLIGFFGLAITAVVQGLVVAWSGSVALFGDTLHNVADALTALPLWVAFRFAKRPANHRFTYGYGRAEDLAGLFVVAMITLSAVAAGFGAVDRLIHPRSVTHLWAVAVAAFVGFLGNEVVGRYRIRVGHRIGSAALIADGLHARTDGFTSLAVLLGALGVALGWKEADPVVGLLITAGILGVLRSAVQQVASRLLDAVDPEIVDAARATIARIDGIQDVRELRIRWIGHTLRAEASVTVPADISLAEAHDLAHHAEEHLLHDVRRLTAATVHASPAGAH